MNKKSKDLAKIEEYKERFSSLTVEEIKKRLSQSFLYKEASIALKQILKEKGEPIDP